MKLLLILFIVFFITTSNVNAHTFTGMIGFYDGISHPVLGLDHFLAMVSVGIISSQIGGRAIWTIPSTFVSIMIFGGLFGITIEMNSIFTIIEHIYIIIELGIIASVFLLGLAIAIEKKLSINFTMVFVGIFGLFHGFAHGLEMPWAVNPILFALGFATGTATLHIFGVGIGYFFTKSLISSIFLRLIGLSCALYGVYLFYNI